MLDPKCAASKNRLYGLVALIFVCGLAVGGITIHMADRHWAAKQTAVLTEAEKQAAVEHFRQELELNPEQAKAIEDILDGFIMQQANLMQQFRSSRISGHDRILQILNEDQRKRFKKVLDELGTKRRD
jgi:t-SNARE complex subunit (syntaxin)